MSRLVGLSGSYFGFEAPFIPPQVGEFLLLLAHQLGVAAVLIGVGLGHPIPQARSRYLQLFRQLSDRFGLLTGELDGSPAELGGVWRRHGDILPGGRSHLRAGVRQTGGSSELYLFRE